MKNPQILILDARTALALESNQTISTRAIHSAASVEDAIDYVDDLAEAGSVELSIEACLCEPRSRPPHVPAGYRIDLHVGEILACMQAEGRVRSLSWIETASAATSADHRNIIAVTQFLSDDVLEKWMIAKSLDSELRWRCRDAALASRQGGAKCRTACRDRSLLPADGFAEMFHGSDLRLPVSDGVLSVNPQRPLWVSPARSFAACFGCRMVRNGDVIQGYDALHPDPRVVVSLPRPLSRVPESSDPIYIHRILVPLQALHSAGTCRALEFQVFSDVQVIDCEGPFSQSDLCREFGVVVESPLNPDFKLNELMDQVSLERIRTVFGMSPADMLQYPSLRRQLVTWLPDELDLRPSEVPGFEPAAALRLLRRCILPQLAERVRFPESYGHGLHHAWQISHLAMLLSILEERPPIAPAVAAALHDAGRIGDDEDEFHPFSGAQIASAVLRSGSVAGLSSERVSMVSRAIEVHSEHTAVENPIQAILRDADRLPLAWERGVESRLFATTSGLRLAHAGPGAAEAAFRRIFRAPLWDTVGFDSHEESSGI